MDFLRFRYIPLRVYGNLNLPPVDVLLLQQKEFFPFLDQIRKNCVFIVMNIFEHQLISDSFCLFECLPINRNGSCNLPLFSSWYRIVFIQFNFFYLTLYLINLSLRLQYTYSKWQWRCISFELQHTVFFFRSFN